MISDRERKLIIAAQLAAGYVRPICSYDGQRCVCHGGSAYPDNYEPPYIEAECAIHGELERALKAYEKENVTNR